ncbi:hypothetical protein B0J18DRAFT_132001 [Chaetomium sp. MPI-SDFR-AT-0129]|nr:hypothetical protein B0J18DRAFT_132001 [Chaetomium sp. MPI-SDFR-AT-0129]
MLPQYAMPCILSLSLSVSHAKPCSAPPFPPTTLVHMYITLDTHARFRALDDRIGSNARKRGGASGRNAERRCPVSLWRGRIGREDLRNGIMHGIESGRSMAWGGIGERAGSADR